jgi:hypothetical protein
MEESREIRTNASVEKKESWGYLPGEKGLCFFRVAFVQEI